MKIQSNNLFFVFLHILFTISHCGTITVCDSGCAHCSKIGETAECTTCSEKLSDVPRIDDEWISTCSCYPNCIACDGPGEFECRTCIDTYCIEDPALRNPFYDGLGRCQNITTCFTASSAKRILSYSYGFVGMNVYLLFKLM